MLEKIEVMLSLEQRGTRALDTAALNELAPLAVSLTGVGGAVSVTRLRAQPRYVENEMFIPSLRCALAGVTILLSP